MSRQTAKEWADEMIRKGKARDVEPPPPVPEGNPRPEDVEWVDQVFAHGNAQGIQPVRRTGCDSCACMACGNLQDCPPHRATPFVRMVADRTISTIPGNRCTIVCPVPVKRDNGKRPGPAPKYPIKVIGHEWMDEGGVRHRIDHEIEEEAQGLCPDFSLEVGLDPREEVPNLEGGNKGASPWKMGKR